MRILVNSILFIICLSAQNVLAKGEQKEVSRPSSAKVLAGWVEKIVVGDLGRATKAKLDTGARTSSIHAKNIEFFEKQGIPWVRFELVLKQVKGKTVKVPMERPRIRKVRIKDHDGDHDRRPVVEIKICFDGRVYTPEFTLANRSEYIYDVLLGRAFLSEVALVDSDKTFQTLGECPQI